MSATDCDLVRLPSGKWQCQRPGCKRRPSPVKAARHCNSPEAVAALNVLLGAKPREHIERETAFFVNHGTATRTADQIAATLDKCFGGCPHLENNVCMAWASASRSNCDARRAAWIEHLIHNDCHLWELPRPPLSAAPHLVASVKSFQKSLGGGMLSLLRVLERARERGYRVTLLYQDRCDGLPDGIEAARVRLPDVADAVVRLRPSVLLETTSYDLVSTISGTPSVVYVQFWRALVKCDPDTLRRVAEPDLPESCLNRAGIETLRRATALVANSDFTASVVERITGRPCDAVVTPTLGDVRVTGGKPVRERRFVTLPSAQILKGTARFFQLARDNPGVEFLLLAGDRYTSPGVGKEAGSIPNVTIRSEWIEDMRDVYAETRALFLGTETCETFSRVCAEARVNGIPLLVLAAGNLPNMITGGGGVAVPRGASDREWNDALARVLAMTPEPTDRFNRDERDKMIDVLDNVRLLTEVAMPTPTAPGIREIVLQSQRVLGTTAVPWNTPVESLREARLVVVPWQYRPELAAAGVPMLVWWCSHFAQMDSRREEYAQLASLVAAARENPRLGVAFTSKADAAVWACRLGDRAVWLPACLDVDVEPFQTTNDDVFIPGPYGPRKNVGTALAACAVLGAEAHVTGKIRGEKELLAIAEALGVRLVIHDCPTVEDVRRAAGSCRAALALSLAETYAYGAAECVLAGTPTVSWAGVPALRPSNGQPAEWLVTDPTDVTEVAERLRAVLGDPDRWHATQLDSLKAVAERNRKAARRALLSAPRWLYERRTTP